MQGYFVSFEGPDGAGKSTVLQAVLTQIKDQLEPQYLVTREPGGSHIAEQIRDMILDPANEAMTAKTEALLYAAQRGQHVEEVVKPALAAGKLVFSDRYVDSSLAYQGAGRGLGIAQVAAINNFATAGLMPDLTIFLDLDPAIGLARIKKARAGSEDRLEQEQLAFHQKVYAGYQEIVAQDPERIKVINANQPLERVVDETIACLKQNLPTIFRS
ncbi:dTMP kinase [Lactobacillus corticis]|uniref:Thymidylate kinase n=1 Tax=Lactobacillus corticis TaxID=2201249 RepID=A0A916QK24_9LACO|nr:dTMP kinase [Lactobacillus corticis]GFZ27297.1 thymidylate kinase [Lactobacillus corticis]